jgi:predicted RNase H-like HicB family nuclease
MAPWRMARRHTTRFCPALKGCHTWGRTYDEALANIREEVELYVEASWNGQLPRLP